MEQFGTIKINRLKRTKQRDISKHKRSPQAEMQRECA